MIAFLVMTPQIRKDAANDQVQLGLVIANIIVTSLCHIINVSFSTGVFPDIWKIA